MKKFIFVLFALVLMSGQAYGYTITKDLTERVDDAETGETIIRVSGTLALDSSHPAKGETILPSQLGMVTIKRFTVTPTGPGAWTAQSTLEAARNLRRFGFDYTANRLYVITTTKEGVNGDSFDVSGPVTYDLSYLTQVPFEAVGTIS